MTTQIATQRKMLLPAAIAWSFVAGCSGGSLSLNYYEPRPVVYSRPVYVREHHICSHDCHDHYWDGHGVVVLRDRHRHGPGCGHYWDGSHWTVSARISKNGHDAEVAVRPQKARRIVHNHGPHCGCAYDRRGNKWIVVQEGHRHGPGCGHVLIEGRWSIRR